MSETPDRGNPEDAPATPELAFSRSIEAIYAFATEPENIDELFELTRFVDRGADQGTPFAEALKRHLSRAETIAKTDKGTTAPQEQSFGIITLDEARGVIAHNQKAIELLGRQLEPLNHGRKPAWQDPETADNFKTAFEGLGARQVTMVRLHDQGHEHMQMGFLVGSALAADMAPATDGTPPAQAALLLPDDLPALGQTLQPEDLGLTPAESRLAQKLQKGLSLKEAAEAIGIAHNTARNQLQSLFTKLGSRRQAELVRNLDALALLHQTIAQKTNQTPATAAGFDYPPHQSIKLNDGRTLAWREYGDPAGFPILMFPSVLATSYMPKREGEIFRKNGLRLLCVERAGRGKSTFDEMGTPQSVAHDIKSLCDALTLDQVSLLGSASGCPFAVATAIHLGNQVKAMGLIAPRLFYNADGGMLGSLPALFYGAAARRPNAARHIINIMKGRATRALGSLMVHRMYKDQPADKHLLETRPDLFDALLVSGIDAFSLQPEGIVRELTVLKGGNQLDYNGLTCKVLTWRGGDDNHFPQEDFEEVTQSFPTSSHRTFAGAGHLILNLHTDDILSDLRAASTE